MMPKAPGSESAVCTGRSELQTVGIAAALFWTLHFLLLHARSLFLDSFGISDAEMALRRLPIHIAGAVIGLGLFALLRLVQQRPLWLRCAILSLCVLPAAALYGLISDLFLWYVLPSLPPERYTPVMLVQDMFPWIGTFASWVAFLLVIDHNAVLRDRERRLAAAQMLAREAQMQALRFQMNPHFLFNTLNSISSSIWEGDAKRAEAMLVSLSSFLRSTLESNPDGDATLVEEFELQRRYLAIEQIRFPDRLSVDFAIPRDVELARVPGLILQPLVENAVKHAVSRSRLPVRLRVSAERRRDQLVLQIEDDGEATGGAAPGAALGLTIVRRRLAARYGNAAQLVAGPSPPAGYKATINLPLEFAP